MIRNINKDIKFLSIPSMDVKEEDLYLADDLKDTLLFHKNGCVGMACNMIGHSKNMIIYMDEHDKMEIMINPVILKKTGEYETEEGCLSLSGTRKCVRYEKIRVEYMNLDLKKRIKNFSGFTAEIIQHEMDHLKGIII